LLAKKNADAFIWHNNHFAYVIAFTEDVCNKIHQKAQARLGIMEDSILTESVYQGRKRYIGNHEASSQKREYAVYTANFGLTERSQKSTRKCKSERSQLIIDTFLVCHHWGKVQETEAV
jgi:hypothetical protein